MRFSTATVVSLFFLAASAVASPIQGVSEGAEVAARAVEEKADGDFGIFGHHNRFDSSRSHNKDVHFSEEKVKFNEHENSHRHRFHDGSGYGGELYRRADAEKADGEFIGWGRHRGYGGYGYGGFGGWGHHNRFDSERNHDKDVHFSEEKVNFNEHENSHRHRFHDGSGYGGELYRRADADKADGEFIGWGRHRGYGGYGYGGFGGWGHHNRFDSERNHDKDVHFSEEKVNFNEHDASNHHRLHEGSYHGF